MQNQTESILEIYKSLKDKAISKTDSFIQKFKTEHSKKKKLSHKTFFELKRICNENFKEFITKIELSKNEAIIIGRALMQTKLKNKQVIIDSLSEYGHSNIIILTHFLTTKCKVDLTSLVSIIENNFNESVDFLKLILIVFRNYRNYFTDKMKDFVLQSAHPICLEIKNNL